MPAAYHLT